MKEQGQNIRELLKEKIKSLGGPFLPHQNYSLMGQLLGLLYNQEIPADLDERIQHRLEDDMMFQMERILYMTENQVQDFLYPTKDEQEEVIQKLEEAETEKDLREYLIHDLLYQKMIDSLEDWPMPWGGGPLLGQNGVFARRVEKKSEQAIGNYTLYQPEIIIDGSHPHPSILVESQAMSGVHLAQTDYIPLLPERTITSGAISKAQFEDIVLDENAHKQIFPNGERRGFFLGAGTGYGKGRNHSIILDNFNKGRKKAVWVSVNEKAHYDSAKIIKYSIQRCE